MPQRTIRIVEKAHPITFFKANLQLQKKMEYFKSVMRYIHYHLNIGCYNSICGIPNICRMGRDFVAYFRVYQAPPKRGNRPPKHTQNTTSGYVWMSRVLFLFLQGIR